MVETGEGKYHRPVEVVSRRAILLPALPFLAVLRENVERLILLVPFREMDLIVGQVIDVENVFQQDRHCLSVTVRVFAVITLLIAQLG